MTKIAKELNNLSIQAKKDAIQSINDALPVFEKFANKVANKRLADAIHTANNNLYVEFEKDYLGNRHFRLNFYPQKRYATIDGRTEYIRYHSIGILYHLECDSIDIEHIRFLLNREKDCLEKEINSMINTQKNIDSIRAKREKLIKELKALYIENSTETCGYYDISTETLYR